MTIDWNHFTPWTSLIGGLLFGLLATLFIRLNGRALGISGRILAGMWLFDWASNTRLSLRVEGAR